MSSNTSTLRRALAGSLAVVIGVLLSLTSASASQAATATGLSLTVVNDDTAASISDTSTTNGIVPVTGGQLTYRWAWSSVPGGGDVTFAQTLPVGVTWNAASIAAGCAVTGTYLTTGETLTCEVSGLADIPGTTDKTATVKAINGGTSLTSKLVSGLNESDTVTVIAGSTSQVQVQIARGASGYMTDARNPTDSSESGLQVPFSMAMYVPGTSTDQIKGQESLGSTATLSFPVTVPTGAHVISCGVSSAYSNNGSFSTLPAFSAGASTANNRAANSGTMTCSQSGTTVTVTFTGVDARLNHVPTGHSNYWPTKGIFALGGMYLWMPTSTFNTSTDTNVTATVSATTFTSVSGLTSSNSSTSVNYPIRLSAFALEQNSASFSNGVPYPGQSFSHQTQLSVPAGSGTSATNAQLCQVWDNSMQRIRTDTSQPSYSGTNITGLTASNFTIEYGTAVYADDAARRAADCGSVGDGSANWFSTVAAAGGAAEVSSVRIRYNRDLDPGQFLNINVNVAAPTQSDLLPSTSNTSGVSYLYFFNNRKSDQTSVQRLGSSYSARASQSMASVRNVIAFTETDVKPGATASVTVTPTITTGNANVTDGRLAINVTETVTLPNGCFTFVPGTPAPVSVTPATPATPTGSNDCSSVAGQVIVWNLGNVSTSESATPISFGVNLNPATPTPVVSTITSVIASNSDKYSAGNRTSTDTINVNTINQFQVSLTSSTASVNTAIPFTYRVGWKNASSSDISGAAYVVDMLPFVGDGRGTAGLGGLTLNSVTTSPSGRPVEYTTDSAADVKTALAGDVSGSTGITWVSTKPASGVTAVRVRTQELVAGAAGYMDMNVTPVAFVAGGVMVNDVMAKADNILSGFDGAETLELDSSSSTVTGFVFHDTDYSGAKNSGDGAVNAAAIELSGFNFGPNGINNTGSNNTIQGDDIAVSLSTTTGSDGAYSFTVSPGVYTVTAPDSVTISGNATDLIVEPTARFEVGGATTVTNKNFGYQEPISPPVAVDDDTSSDSALTIYQGATVDIDVLGNDTTYVPAGVPATTVSSHTDPARGTLVLNDDDTFTYTANAVWPGSVSGLTYTSTFDYTLTNPQGTSTATVTVTVRRLPSGAADTGVVADRGTVNLNVLTNDYGDTIAFDSANPPTTDGSGTVSVSGSALRFVAATHVWGSSEMSYVETLTYNIVDAAGNEATGTATVTVYRAPIVVNDSVVTRYATPVTVAVLDNDTVGSGSGTVTVRSQPATGTATVSGSSIVFTPTSNQTGTVSIGYRVTDSLGQYTDGTLSVNVAANFTVANDGTSASRIRVPQAGETLDVVANDTGTTLTLDSVTTPTNGTATISAGDIVYTPTAGFSGAVTFSYTVSDITGQTKTGQVYLYVVAAPSATDDTGFAVVSTAKNFNVAGNDTSDGAGTVTIVTGPSSGTATIDAGKIRVTPSASTGTITVTYRLTDDVGQSDTATLTVTVVQELIATNDGSAIAPRTITQSGDDIDVLDNDFGTDIEIDSVGTPGFGTATITSGLVRYTPLAGFSGADNFTYTITDSVGQTETATVYVDVVAAPNAEDDSGWTAPNVTKTFTVTSNDDVTDLDSVTIVSQPSAGLGTATVSGFDIEFEPGSTEGTAVITYRVTDSLGQTDDATLTVEIVDGFQAFDDGSDSEPIPVGASGADIDVLSNDAAYNLTITAVSSPANGTAVIDGDVVTYTPSAGYSGADSFTYTAVNESNQSQTATVYVVALRAPVANADEGWTTVSTSSNFDVIDNDISGEIVSLEIVSGPNRGSASFVNGVLRFAPGNSPGTATMTYRLTDIAGQTASATLTVRVVDVFSGANDGSNVSPILVPQSPSNLDVLANDSGTGLRIQSVGNPSNGAARVSAGLIRYTPRSGYAGMDSFTYSVVDATGRTDSATVTVLVVSGPLLVPDFVSTRSETAVTVDVLANDTVTDNSTISISAQAQMGRASLDGTSILYVPALASEGPQIVKYRVVDALGQAATSRLQVEVRTDFIARNDGDPTDPIVVPADGRAIFVLNNDEGAGLSITGVDALPAGGTTTILGESVFYQPVDGFTGADSFTYSMEDRNGNTASATVFVLVTDEVAEETTTEPTVTTPGSGNRIDLNVFDESFTKGKTLTLGVGQVIHFSVPADGEGESEHTVTVNAVGPDYVDITVRSEPIRDRLFVGSTERYDVDFDGDADIEATLDSIDGGLADVTFTILPADERSPNALAIGLIALASLVAVGLWLFFRRKRRTTSNR